MSFDLKKFFNNFVSTLLISSLAAQPILAQAIVTDANGPTIIETANGTTMVMIATPDENGVSHNVFVEFGVDPNGAILNNADENTFLTTLAGQVQGNYNLTDGAANIIISEVTASNPSVLNGFIEIAGQRADLIVANPYGITCDGCGFINTDQLTMTTGTPEFTDGTFTGLSVEDGAIEIGSAGLDASGTTQFDIISRQIQVAGAVDGQRIRLIAGRNDVIYATGEIIEKPANGSATPTLAIDSTVLGGMYADAITITSTEDGVGVRAPTNMAANAGQMVLTADGRLVIGSASAVGAVTVESTDDIVVEDTLAATQGITVTTAEDLILQANAELVADAAANLTVGNSLSLGSGAELAAGTAILASANSVDIANAADLISNAGLNLDANTIQNAGTIGATGGALDLTAAAITNTGLLFGDSAANVMSDGTITNTGGAIVSNSDVTIAGATGALAAAFINQNGGTVESVAGDISIAAATIENTRPDPTINGAVTVSDTDLTGETCAPVCFDPSTVGTDVTENGAAAQIIASAGNITLEGTSVLNSYSLISAGENVLIDVTTLTNIGMNIYRPDPSDSTALVLIGALFGTIEAAGAIVGNVDGYVQNGAFSNGAIVSGGVDSNIGDISSTNVGNPNLLIVNVDPDAEFLVESRPEFVDLDLFISSDYFLAAIEYDPELKRFGDAYAEALYIRKQLLALLGQLFLEAGLDERAQIQAMYDNAIDAQQNLDLTVGVALTPTQISALTTDIIWLEETIIDGQRVLAPKVYLANPEVRFAALSGAMIVGGDISVNTGSFYNAGTVQADNAININVDGTFRSQSGVVSAEDILISAETIEIDTGASRVLSERPSSRSAFIAAIISELVPNAVTEEEIVYDFRERAARPSTLDAGNTLVLRAAGDIVTQGADIRAGNGAAFIAGGDIVIGALQLSAELGDEKGKNHDRRESLTYLTSTITSGGDISLLSTGNAGNQGDIFLQGATLRADGALGMIAQGGDIVLAAAADIWFRDKAKSRGGFIYKKVTRDQVFDISHQVTSLTGATITGVSNQNILVEGASFDVPGLPGEETSPAELALISVNAGLAFTAPTDIRAESHYSSRKILGGLITNSKDLRTLVTDSLGSVAETAGDMFLNSGADLTLTSVDFQVGGAFNTEVAGATYMMAAIDMDYRFLVEHRDNGIITTDIRQEDLRERITYNAITAAGGVNFDQNSPIVFAGVRNPLIDSAHPGAWVGGNDTNGQLNIVSAFLGGEEARSPESANAEGAAEDTYWRDDDEWSEEGKLRIIQASLPTSADGAQFAFMDGLLARDTTIIDPVELADYHFKEVKRSISPAFQALVSIAVGQWVGGWAVWGNISNTFLAAAGEAFTSSFITQSIAGVVSGEFDVGAMLEGAAFAGVSAGLTAQIDLGAIAGASDVSLIGAQNGLLSPTKVLDGFGDTIVKAGLNTAVYDTNFGENFQAGLQGFAINQATSAVQFGIGELKMVQEISDGGIGASLLHGVVGCLSAEASGGSCGSGFVAGFGTELVSGMLTNGYVADPTKSPQEQEAARRTYENNNAALVGAALGYITSGGNAVNVNQGSFISGSAIANNRQLHTAELVALRQKAAELSGGDPELQAEWLARLTKAAMARVDRNWSRELNSNDLEAIAALDEMIAVYGESFTDNVGLELGFLNETNQEYFNNTMFGIEQVIINRNFYDDALRGWSPDRFAGLENILSPSDMVILSAGLPVNISQHILPENDILDDAVSKYYRRALLELASREMATIVTKLQDVDVSTLDSDTWSPYIEALIHSQMVLDGTSYELYGTFGDEKVRNQLITANGMAGLGSLIIVSEAAAASLRTCVATPGCLKTLTTSLSAELTTAAYAEFSGAMTATAASLGLGAAAGKFVLLKHGDEIMAVIDDFGRVFTPVSGTVDDTGRFMVRNADGVVGYLDEAHRFVPDFKAAPNGTADLPTITQNQIRHNQAVEDANVQFEANGLRTTTEVTLDSCTGTRCRADTVIQGEDGQTSTPVPNGFTAYDLNGNQLDSIPLGSNGQGIAIVETKTGNATLSGNQSVVYPEVSKGTVSGAGNNATNANLGGTVPADTPVVILTPE